MRRSGVWKRARYFSSDFSCREEIENVRTNVGLLDSSTLGAAAKQRLNKVADTLNQHTDTQIQIRGYTDTSGSEDYNLTLSDARATAVSGYLIQRGVSGDRIESVGFGPASPIASNLTADGRRSNRRVEIQVRAGNVSAFR